MFRNSEKVCRWLSAFAIFINRMCWDVFCKTALCCSCADVLRFLIDLVKCHIVGTYKGEHATWSLAWNMSMSHLVPQKKCGSLVTAYACREHTLS